MATPEPLEPSHRLSKAALAERERILRRLDQLEQRRTKLADQLHKLDGQRDRLHARLALLDQLAPEPGHRAAEPLSALDDREPPNGYLKGAEIRREAVRLFAETGQRAPIHYTDWLALLQEAGFAIKARDPAATFLTQITRSPLVARADRPGLYVLDLDAPARLRTRLADLNSELLALHDGQQTLEAIISTRERREQLITEIGRTERALEDALTTLPQTETPG